MMGVPRLAVLADYLEEGWPSMDLVSRMFLAEAGRLEQVRAEGLCPPFLRRLTRLPWLGRSRFAFNTDRLFNRFRDYPRYLRKRRWEFDLFHLCDHSYGQVLHELPGPRAGVYCHDLDTFRCLLYPDREPRPFWFRAMARRILTGMQRAAVVFHSTAAVRDEIERHGLLDPGRLVHAPYGVAEEFTAEGEDPGETSEIGEYPFLLHVGSCIPRKRIDVLLDVFAAVRLQVPELRLVKVSGEWSLEQREQIDRLAIRDAIVHRTNLDRGTIARYYRRASLVLLPSEAEGFGLPVIEGLACGAIVVASDLPVLREVAGDAAVYCPVGDTETWTEAVRDLLGNPGDAPARNLRLAQAARYTWAAHARTIVGAYQRLLGEPA